MLSEESINKIIFFPSTLHPDIYIFLTGLYFVAALFLSCSRTDVRFVFSSTKLSITLFVISVFNLAELISELTLSIDFCTLDNSLVFDSIKLSMFSI